MEKMLAGRIYNPADPEIQGEIAANRRWLAKYNSSMHRPKDVLRSLLNERLKHVGAMAFVRPPFFCDFGFNITLGAGSFLNFNCVILDVNGVEIGESTQIGPSVQIYTADHPRDRSLRRDGLESGRAVRIGRNVWIGGGAIILPGVRIGDDAIVGAGSVMTREVPEGATAFGNPARVR